jgi:hypothetical protein
LRKLHVHASYVACMRSRTVKSVSSAIPSQDESNHAVEASHAKGEGKESVPVGKNEQHAGPPGIYPMTKRSE